MSIAEIAIVFNEPNLSNRVPPTTFPSKQNRAKVEPNIPIKEGCRFRALLK